MSANRWTVLAMAGLFALAGFLFMRAQEQAATDIGRLDTYVLGDRLILQWMHPIRHPMALRFKEAFHQHRDDVSTIIIDLNSPGGAVTEGAKMIDFIEKMGRSHKVIAHVGVGRRCASMCGPIFLAADERVASARSQWLFHQPFKVNAITRERRSGPEFERRLRSARFANKRLRGAVDDEWLDQLEKDWQAGDVIKTGEELVAEGSGVIDRLHERGAGRLR